MAREPAHQQLLRLEKALDTMQVGVTITDINRRIVYVNRAEADMHGYTKEELVGQDATILAPKKIRTKPMGVEALKQLKSWHRESANERKDGSTFPVEVLSDAVMDAQGSPIGLVTIARNITEQKRAEAKLKESEQRYALAVQGANDGIWDWNLQTDQVYFSDRWKLMLGYARDEIEQMPEEWWSRVHDEDLDRLKRDLGEHLEGVTEQLHSEHRMLHRDGDHRWMLARGVVVRDDRGVPTRIAGSLTDVTDRKVHDPLTRLPNRALLTDRLKSSLRRQRRQEGRVCAVLFLDLDRFKVVNDSLGHPAGDVLLQNVARVLRTCLRPSDTVARMGGDEFTILLDEVTEDTSAIQVAERILAELTQPFLIGEQEIFTTASIGIAFSSTGYENPEDLLRDADTAMYRAKSQGTGRYQIFDRHMRRQAIDQLRVETDIRHALEREEFEIYYQPILSLRTEQIVGMEALIRWNHPERGLLHPNDFIQTAEETGLILPIGRWVLVEACRQLARWRRKGPAASEWKVSVNLSPKQFNHPRLIRDVKAALDSTGVEPDWLQLEVTESIFIDNLQVTSAMIAALREMGVTVAIDDFGTGYSSLGYLDQLPIDILKIDRSFIDKLGMADGKGEMVETILKMAENLEIEVVAEGVETKGQMSALKQLHCGFMQGYLFSRPATAGEIQSRFIGN
jgi:diguanylate cyclase (GGDEF)-like protein/PAS domain S-box-containing protein